MKKAKKFISTILICLMILPSTTFAKETSKTIYLDISDQLTKSSLITTYQDAQLTDNEVAFIECILDGFSKLSEEINVESYKISIERFGDLYNNLSTALQNDHPEIFYLEKVGYRYNPTTQVVTSISPVYIDSVQLTPMLETIENEVKNIKSQTNEQMTDFEKILAVHDYIVANYEYDGDYEIRTLYPMIVEKKAVCQGYAYLFQIAMKELGFECVTVPSNECSHMWNKIKLNGEWYNVDLTSDDPTKNRSTNISHEYFLLNDDEIKNDKTKLHLSWNPYKWDGKTPVETSDSTAYSDSIVHDISGQIIYKDGIHYSFVNLSDSRNNICTVNFEDNSVNPIYTDSSEFVWKTPDDIFTYSTYRSALVLYNNELYFNSPNKVFKFDTTNNSAEEIYEYKTDTPNLSETYFFGLTIKNNILYGEYTDDLNEGIQEFVKVLEIALPTPTPDVTPIPFPQGTASTTINEDGNIEVTLTIPDNIKKTSVLYVAQYREDNTLITVNKFDTSTQMTPFTPNDDTSYVKSFVLSNNQAPLVETSPVSIS